MNSERKGIKFNSEIERLEQLLNQKKMEQSLMQRNCKHKWAKPIYDAEEISEFVFTHYEWKGVDPIPQGSYKTVEKPRWSKTCEECGKKEYTYERKPIIVGYEPSFG